ncbi:MAG: hypothetical protein M3O15_16650, partial [Acidobacteriota bacterium]|nr:hypothetical protein [Acidobacteriota bacterium]
MSRTPSDGGSAGRRTSRPRAGKTLVLSTSLRPAFSPQGELHLEESRPDGSTTWRITAPFMAWHVTGQQEPGATSEAETQPQPLVMPAIELTVWPDAYFTLASMVLCGAQITVPGRQLAAAAQILSQAVTTAPARVQLPDGRRVQPKPGDLAQLVELAARFSAAEVPAEEFVVGRLQTPPWT